MYPVIVKRLYMLAVTLFTTLSIYAQVAYHNFNTNSGLPSNEVYCVFQDKEGYMWFGTDHGVAKYNGYEFQLLTTTDGLTDNTVFEIQQDKQGNLWFLTLTGGICYYNGTKCLPHPMNDTITAICRRQMPTSWYIGDDYNIWLAGVKEGFYKVTKDKIYSYLSHQPAGFKNDEGDIWVVKFKDGGYVYTLLVDDKFKSFNDEDIASIKRYELHWDYLNYYSTNFQLVNLPDGNVIVAIDRRVINLSDKGIVTEYAYPKDQRSIKLRSLANGDIWLTGVNAPIYKIDSRKGQLLFTDSVNMISVSDITSNEIGNIWLTTIDKGIYILPEIGIRRYEYGTKLVRNKVTYFKAGVSKLYIPVTGSDMLTINSTMGAVLEEGPKEPIAITSMEFDESGNPLTNYDYRFHRDSATPNPEFFFTKIAYLGKSKFIAGGTGGFGLFNDQKLIYSSRNYGFSHRVTDIIVLKKDNYLIGTTTGLYYFNSTLPNGGITAEPLLKEVRITSAATITGKYAVATRGKGVYIFSGQQTYKIDESAGLVSDLTEDVFFENDTLLWVATFQGISKIVLHGNDAKRKYTVYSYTTDDGLCSNQINAIDKFNGRIWLATNEGVCYFYPDKLKTDTAIIPLYITSFLANGKKYDGKLDALLYSENNISIEYNALYYNAIKGVRYKVRLKGLEEWRYTDRHSVQYYVLAAGNYVFQVAAEDKFGRYKSAIREIKFTIKPHFTNTFQFKAIIGLIVFSILVLIIYLLFAYQRFKAQNVIKLLQSEFKALNYQINPHFIFNVLNSIQYYILRKDSEKAVNFLSSFSTLIRRIVSNSRQQYISVIEEVECLKDYLDLEKLRLEDKFDYELNIDSNVDIEQKIMLPMIIQPLVENSIWHGIVPLEGRGKIKVDFKKNDDGAVVCIVDDNGVGINSARQVNKKEQNNLSLAMSNVKERLKIIGELNGSEWFINFKDKAELGNNERGTIVTIKFPITRKE